MIVGAVATLYFGWRCAGRTCPSWARPRRRRARVLVTVPPGLFQTRSTVVSTGNFAMMVAIATEGNRGKREGNGATNDGNRSVRTAICCCEARAVMDVPQRVWTRRWTSDRRFPLAYGAFVHAAKAKLLKAKAEILHPGVRRRRYYTPRVLSLPPRASRLSIHLTPFFHLCRLSLCGANQQAPSHTHNDFTGILRFSKFNSSPHLSIKSTPKNDRASPYNI